MHFLKFWPIEMKAIHFQLLIPYFCGILLQEIKILDQAGNRKQHQKLKLQGIIFHSVLSILVVHFTNCMNDLTPAKLFQSELLVHELCIEGTVQISRAPTNLQTHWYKELPCVQLLNKWLTETRRKYSGTSHRKQILNG